jgi:photosystem II stability/assembly factor-like uncharacterized protein
MIRNARHLIASIFAVIVLVFAAAPSGQQSAVDPSLYSGLHWRMIGPFRGGRVDAVSGVPGRPYEFYFGHVNGGVWKTVNAGRTWAPVFDGQPVASIGAIAVAQTNPDVVYVGSGESTLRDSNGYGNGVYKSTDAGRTWTHLGLDLTHHIGRVAIDPKNADVAYVAAIGDLYAATPDRGIYKTTDGGKTWTKSLFKDANTGAVDVAIDPSNSRIVYASLWATRRTPWYTYAPSNSPGGGIYKSTDAGATWTQLTNGLPVEGLGRSGLAIAPSNPRRVYAIIDAKEGGLYRSDDAGATWVKTTDDTRVWGRGWYFEKVVVDPTNPDIVFVPNVGIQKSKDGGKTFGTFAVRGSPGGDDYHQLWISSDPNVMIVASDQGSVVTMNGTADTPEWSSWYNQPTAQLYHVAVTNGFPWLATGAQQDSGAVWVRSRSFTATLSTRDWQGACAGGESGYTAPDPMDPDKLFGGTVSTCRLDVNGSAQQIPPPPGPEKPREDWTQPLVFSKADPHALYYANQYVYKTTDGGANWTRISDDLTRPEPGTPPTLDAVTAQMTDRNGRRGVVYTIAPSPVLKPLLWVGSDDGLIQLSSDDGGKWINVTPAAINSWSRVTMMEASHFDFNEAYAAVDRHQLDDFTPHIYRTRDLGKSWQDIARGLPRDGYVHFVKEDPKRRGLLFAGTERRVFVSFDDGDNWQSLQLNLPVTSVRDIEIHGDDAVLATHGRGFWVLDDIGSLRQLNASSAQQPAMLFKPTDALAIVQGGDNGTPWQKDEPQAENAPVGAVIDYYLRSAAGGPVVIDILDPAGKVVRSYASNVPAPAPTTPQTVSALWVRPPAAVPAAAGMHRWMWDLRETPPPAARGGGGGGGGFGRQQPMLTGPFTVRLTVDGQTLTQPLMVKPDPRTK